MIPPIDKIEVHLRDSDGSLRRDLETTLAKKKPVLMKTKLPKRSKSLMHLPGRNGPVTLVTHEFPPGTAPMTTAIRLDIGSGPNGKPGFVHVDQIAFPGVDVVTDLRKEWPWKDGSVEEVHSSHCLEHFTAVERCWFFNELYRVLKPGAKSTLITPHWSSCRAYGDPTHQWPPISEFLWYYLKRDWRMSQAPHTDAQHWPQGFNCNFEVTWGYSLEPSVAQRNQEYQQMAIQYYKEACQDMVSTLVAIKEPQAGKT